MAAPAGGVERTFVGLPSPVVGRAGAGGHPCQGLWHTPSADPHPTTAFIATHYNVDFSEHYLADFMARRGYGFLGWNTRFRGAEAYFVLDHALADIGVGVRFLREQGVERVVLLGNSGGGSLMGAYHSQSVEPNIRPARGRTVLPEAMELPGCDLYVSVASHPGRPEVLTDWLDASVIDEFEPTSRDPSLDPFDPGPPYDAEFVTRYRAAQRDRNARITAWCHAELDRLEAVGIGDRLFTMTRTWADLRMMDGALDPSDRKTPWCYGGDPPKANAGVFGLGVLSTCRSWLNMWSLTDSDCRGGPHLARLHLPALVVNASGDAGVFPSQAQELYDAIASTDKRLEQMPGDHYFQEPANARDDVADLIAAWVAEH
jgi:alpha-beta hydrolase superfamily lysophospholipase